MNNAILFRCALVGLWMAALAIGPMKSALAADAAKRVAVLDIELLKADYLPNAERTTEEDRQLLNMSADLIRTRLRKEGYDVVPASLTREAIAAADPGQRLHQCNGCEIDIAQGLNADWVAIGWIQVVSYLIVNLNVVVLEVEKGREVGRAFVDLRGYNERSLKRATLYLLDHLLVERLAKNRAMP
ncbi:DUF2380 domain-containing protein [Thioalkalivibrio sp. HK1]|uniref:DUF2380 domain-containing protein n=1 Tax=Thioalkalivibrio sp. HK1 TaxID=1469245 RepID=UPI0012DD66FA|nr:DUF2380 domain-containing protein [Thioalkalivibrio sp. HK1]